MDERNFQYMFYGFLVAWGLVFAYVLGIGLRERRLKQELQRVKAMLAAHEKESAK